MIHQFAIRPTGGGGGGATASLKISAGTLSALRTDVTFSNSNGVSFGLNAAGVVTATVQTNYLTTAMASNRGSDFVQATAAFAGTNASGTINSTGISVSVAAQSAQSINVSAGTTSNNLTAVTFSNSNNVSFGLNASTLTASIATTYAGTGFTTATTAGTAVVGTLNTSGLSLGVPAFLTTAMQSNAATISNINVSAGTTSTNASAFTFSNSNNVSFGLGTGASAGNITASIATTYAGTGITTTTTAGTAIAGTLNTSGLSLGVPAFLTTADLSQNSSKYAGTAFATTTAAGAVIAGTMNTSGLTLGVPAFLTTAMASNAATISNINISAGTTSTNASAFTFSNSNQISFGLGTGASAGVITASIDGFKSYWYNLPFIGTTAVTAAQSNSSYIFPFVLPYYLSASYLRLIGSFSVNGINTWATSVNTTFSASILSTIDAVVYSLGTGASSNSLMTVASGSAGFSYQWSWQAGAVGSNWSQTVKISYPTQGTTSQFSTSGGETSTNFTLDPLQVSFFTGFRYLDIPFANSLTPGPYWLGMGNSSTTSTQGNSNVTITISCSTLGISQVNSVVADLGITSNVTQYAVLGQGIFTSNLFGNNLNLNLLTRIAQQPLLHMQFIRQA